MIRRTLLIGITWLLVNIPALAQTSQQTYSFGSNLGSLAYTVDKTVTTCSGSGGLVIKQSYTFGGFSFTSVTGSMQAIPGSTFYKVNGNTGCSTSPPQSGPTITFNGSGYQIVVTPGAGLVSATITVPGYVNPKYVVVGVIYAPPGSKSVVTYTNSNTISNTSSVTNTFMSSFTRTVKVTRPGGLFGFLGGTQTTTNSTTLTQQSQTSDSVTASQTTTSGLQLSGPGSSNNCGPLASDFIGVDHDCDEIEIWINPVTLFTLTNNGQNNPVVQWNGYGFSSLDQTAPIDIVKILVGCLNGDLPTGGSMCAPPLSQLRRSWAENENWPSGQGPGLTQSDLNNILAADPWGQCKPNSPIGSGACPTFSNNSGNFVLLPPQFTLSDLEDVPYSQASPGTATYTVSTTSSNTQGEESKTTFSQTFGVEDAFTGTDFLKGFGASVSESQTLEWNYEVNSSTTLSGTFTGMVNITSPACNGDPCNPAYPPNPLAFGTGTEFDIFVDNFFGSFVFVPSFYQ